MNKQLRSFQQFIKNESFSGILLFLATFLAVIIANSSYAQSYFDLWHTKLGVAVGTHILSMDLSHWINDGLMALFFLMGYLFCAAFKAKD